VTRAFLFYFVASARNRGRARLARLRKPKYLVSAIAGLFYFYAFFLRFLFQGRRLPRQHLDAAYLPAIEVGTALVLMVFTLLPWILPGRGSGLSFSAAEIQFLFQAPLGRRTLINFRLIKGQIGILFGVAVSTVLMGRGGFLPHPWFLTVDLWLVYSFIALYNTGVHLARTSLSEHGIAGWKRQGGAVVVLVAMAASVTVWLRWFVPAPPAPEEITPLGLAQWVEALAQSGPARWFLLPFRALVRPAFQPSIGALVLSLIPALGILGLLYLWLVQSDARFEEAALERSEALARARESGKARAAVSGRRRPWFRLAPGGPAFVAIVWKNLIGAGRVNPWAGAVIAAGFVTTAAISAFGPPPLRRLVPGIVGSVTAGIAVFTVTFGPLLRREDLRSDLLHSHWLKSAPLPGWSVVLGEVLAPTVVLAAGQWLLLAFAAAFWPGLGGFHPSAYARVMLALGAAILLPAFSLLGILIQNAVTLMLPGWAHLGKEHKQGIEAMGQRLITMAGALVVLLVAVLPSAAVFALFFFVLYRVIGLAVVPLAAAAAVVGLVAEAAIAIGWLGRVFDQFDPSDLPEVLEAGG
jgi:ABC-2 type transport system permease protein